MLPYPLEQLDELKLQQICEERTSETLTLEFKRHLPGKASADKLEFLKDVAALANAEGGDLVYGIEEQDGCAYRLFALTAPSSPDAEKRRLGQMLDGGLEPRVPGLRLQDVPVDNGFILILRISQSYAGPHRIAYEDNKRFPLRTGTHTSEMSYSQLKIAFDRTAALAERAKTFRQERLRELQLGKTLQPIAPGPLGVAHVIPLASMAGRHSVDVARLPTPDIMFKEWGHTTRTFNLDGVVAHSPVTSEQSDTYGYNQVFRSGATESVFFGSGFLTGKNVIPSTTIAENFRLAVGKNITFIRKADILGPVIVGVAMLRVEGYVFAVDSRKLADRDSMILPEIWIDDLASVHHFDEVVRPALDVLWQAFGFERCADYAYDGKWSPL